MIESCMESIHQRVETWVRDQRARVTWPPQWKVAVRWPWAAGRERRKLIKEEFERKKKQFQDLCNAVQAESISDLQDILCCMLLSECVYKRPSGEMIRAVNKFKADFGGHLISLERVQPSGDHVPHRYLLAEAGDTLFAAFIGTKQYKDIMADVNIFQGALFHEDAIDDLRGVDSSGVPQVDSQKNNGDNISNSTESKPNEARSIPKPAVHRGFMARAKGIPALELYRLAQRKRRKLVLCGHSLGGAVAVLATLAILRVVAASSRETERVQVKCITFSQPPVGNSALRDYVNKRGWQQHFKTYCIPEDLVPRILSPAYFHHYNTQVGSSPADVRTSQSALRTRNGSGKLKVDNGKETEGEQLVLGLGPVQTSFWRLSKLVPLETVKKQLYRYTGKLDNPIEASYNSDSSVTESLDDIAIRAQSLEIEEGSDGISLRPLPETEADTSAEAKNGRNFGKTNSNDANKRPWRRMPALPSYVPFGQLYILGHSAVESLSGAEYSKLTSVRSVIAEVRERFQSHSMKSYRSRFQRIYDLCMDENATSFPGMEQAQQFPQLQKWLGISVAGTVELGHIVESPVICAATSVVPLGWSGLPREKNGDMLKVDISGFGLHLCSIVEAKVDGKWCSTTFESFPPQPAYPQDHGLQPEIQRMRILVGAPLKRPPKHNAEDSPGPIFSSIDSAIADLKAKQNISSNSDKFIKPDGLGEFVIFCTNDFFTVSREVHVRTRRVRLIGPEGAGKSSLLKAILDPGRNVNNTFLESLNMDTDVREGIAGGLCYSDSVGVNLQNIVLEASNFRDELWKGIRDLSMKTDLVVLVHNLSHRIPQYTNSNTSQVQPALTLLLEEAKSLGIPWVLAITNKFSVSAHQQKAVINTVLQAYHAMPSTTEIINSFPYIAHTATGSSLPWCGGDPESDGKMGAQKLIFAPLDMVRRPFQKRNDVLPVEGVTPLCELIHRVLRDHEEAALEELARDRLYVGLAQQRALVAYANREALGKENSYSAAAVGASLGAGLGIILAVVMGAASALRKP